MPSKLGEIARRLINAKPGVGTGTARRAEAPHGDQWRLPPHLERMIPAGAAQPRVGQRLAFVRRAADEIVGIVAGPGNPFQRNLVPATTVGRAWRGEWRIVRTELIPNMKVYGGGQRNCFEREDVFGRGLARSIIFTYQQIPGPGHPVDCAWLDPAWIPTNDWEWEDQAGQLEYVYAEPKDMLLPEKWHAVVGVKFFSLLLANRILDGDHGYPYVLGDRHAVMPSPQTFAMYAPTSAWFVPMAIYAHLPFAVSQCWRTPWFDVAWDSEEGRWYPVWRATGAAWTWDQVFVFLRDARAWKVDAGTIGTIQTPRSGGFSHHGHSLHFDSFDAQPRYTPGICLAETDHDGSAWVAAAMTWDGISVYSHPIFGLGLPAGTYFYAASPVSGDGVEMGCGPAVPITLTDDPVLPPLVPEVKFIGGDRLWTAGTYEVGLTYARFNPASGGGFEYTEETMMSATASATLLVAANKVLSVKFVPPQNYNTGGPNGATCIWIRKTSGPSPFTWERMQWVRPIWGYPEPHKWWTVTEFTWEEEHPPGGMTPAALPVANTLRRRAVRLWAGSSDSRCWQVPCYGTEALRIYRAGPYGSVPGGYIPSAAEMRLVYNMDFSNDLDGGMLPWFELYMDYCYHSGSPYVRWYSWVRVQDEGMAGGPSPGVGLGPVEPARVALMIGKSTSTTSLSGPTWKDVHAWRVVGDRYQHAILVPVSPQLGAIIYSDGDAGLRAWVVSMGAGGVKEIVLDPYGSLPGGVVKQIDEHGDALRDEWLITYRKGAAFVSAHLAVNADGDLGLHDEQEIIGAADLDGRLKDSDLLENCLRPTAVAGLEPPSYTAMAPWDAKRAVALFDGTPEEPAWSGEAFTVDDIVEFQTHQAPALTDQYAWALIEALTPGYAGEEAKRGCLIAVRFTADDAEEAD